MRYLPCVTAGIAGVALAGSMALAARQNLPLHNLTVQLPDGGTVHVQYAGKIPPRVTVGTSPFAVSWPGFAIADFGPSFAELQRISADMERQMDAFMRNPQSIDRISTLGAGDGLQTIKMGSLPPGSVSYSFVSSSNGHSACSKMVEVTSPANGGKPKVVSHTSGNCSGAAASAKGDRTDGDTI